MVDQFCSSCASQVTKASNIFLASLRSQNDQIQTSKRPFGSVWQCLSVTKKTTFVAMPNIHSGPTCMSASQNLESDFPLIDYQCVETLEQINPHYPQSMEVECPVGNVVGSVEQVAFSSSYFPCFFCSLKILMLFLAESDFLYRYTPTFTFVCQSLNIL